MVQLVSLNKLGRRNGVFTYFLSSFPNTDLALSLQQLSNKSTDVIRVRRSRDNAESDFNANEVKNGTLLNWAVPTDVQALYDNRMYFDGVNDNVSIPDNASLDLSNVFKIRAKFIPTTKNADYLGVVGKWNGGTNQRSYLISWQQTDGISFFISSDGSTTSVYLKDSDTTVGVLKDIEVIHTGTQVQLWVNGVMKDSVASTVTPFNSSDNLYIGSYNGGLGTVNIDEATIYDVEIEDGGTVISSYQGYGNTNADWEDQLGSNDGTVNGSPALFTGQGFYAFVPIWYDQTIDRSDIRARFNGDADFVSLPVQIYNGDAFDITIKGTWEGTGSVETIFGNMNNTSSYGLRVQDDGEMDFFFGGFSDGVDAFRNMGAVGGVTSGVEYTWRVKYDGNQSVQIYRNGSLIKSGNLTGIVTDSGNLCIGNIRGANPTQNWTGILSNITLDLGDTGTINHQWNGYGDSSSDWTDLIGSANGTVTGQLSDRFRIIGSSDSLVNYRAPRDATQTTAGNQPQIISNGSLITVNGKPALDFNGTSQYFTYTTFIPKTIIAVSSSDTSTGIRHLIGKDGFDFNFRKNGTGWGVDTANDFANSSTLWINGSIGVGSSAQELSFASDNSWAQTFDSIGSGNFLSRYWNGKIQEIIMSTSNISSDRTAIESNINRRYKIY